MNFRFILIPNITMYFPQYYCSLPSKSLFDLNQHFPINFKKSKWRLLDIFLNFLVDFNVTLVLDTTNLKIDQYFLQQMSIIVFNKSKKFFKNVFGTFCRLSSENFACINILKLMYNMIVNYIIIKNETVLCSDVKRQVMMIRCRSRCRWSSCKLDAF